MGNVETKLTALFLASCEERGRERCDIKLANGIDNVVRQSPDILGDSRLQPLVYRITWGVVPEGTKPYPLSEAEKQILSSAFDGVGEATEAWFRNWLQEKSTAR